MALNELNGMKIAGCVVDIKPCLLTEYNKHTKQPADQLSRSHGSESLEMQKEKPGLFRDSRRPSRVEHNRHPSSDRGHRDRSPHYSMERANSQEGGHPVRRRSNQSPNYTQHESRNTRRERHISDRAISGDRADTKSRGGRHSSGDQQSPERSRRSSITSNRAEVTSRTTENPKKPHPTSWCVVISGLPPKTSISDMEELLKSVQYNRGML